MPFFERDPSIALSLIALYKAVQLCAVLFVVLLMVDCFASLRGRFDRPKQRIGFNLFGIVIQAFLAYSAQQLIELTS